MLDKIQIDVNEISNWAKDHHLSINPTKTKIMFLGSSYYIENTDFDSLPKITLNNMTIPIVDSVRNLGLVIDSTLSWNEYLSDISKRVWYTLRQLKRSHSVLSLDVRKLLVQSLIFPKFDYCCLAVTDLNLEQKRKLQVLLNSCVRFIFRLNRTVHVSQYLTQLGWLTVENRRNYLMGSFTYALIINDAPEYLSSRILERSSFVPRLRSTFLELMVPYFSTRVYENSFMVNAIKFWNNLPEEMRRSTSLNIFKNKLYTYLSDN